MEQLQGDITYPLDGRAMARRSGPFWLRRPWLIVRDLVTSRERPNLRRLADIRDPESFVWSILPHAARTFSACIALLPARSALPAAVAYLYCRMLDTYEDLVPDPVARDASLRDFAARLAAEGTDGVLPPAPVIRSPADRDDRDRAHLLLVRRAGLVDQLYVTLPASTRAVVRDLVVRMADGMRWSSRTFAEQHGVLTSDAQLEEYCRHVLGNPVVFSIRLLRLHYGHSAELTDAETEDAMRVGELVQLANVARDIEKDLRRGVAYHPALADDVRRDVQRENDPDLTERCRLVREAYWRMALRRAPSYARVVESIRLPRVSVARASALLMLLFTERFYRGTARRVGQPAWDGPDSMFVLLSRSMTAAVSRRSAEREFGRVERAFLAAANS